MSPGNKPGLKQDLLPDSRNSWGLSLVFQVSVKWEWHFSITQGLLYRLINFNALEASWETKYILNLEPSEGFLPPPKTMCNLPAFMFHYTFESQAA